MKIKNFEISNINKMLDRLIQIKELYNELSEEIKERFNNEFSFEKKPLYLTNHLEIVLEDCLDILQEQI